jgi:hypothetical protein
MATSGPVRGSVPARPPAGLRVAALLLALEALAAAAYGVAEALQAQSGRIMVGLGAAAVLLVYAVGLASVARGLLRVRRWARGPAVATQLIHLPVAYSFRGGETWWVALLLGGFAVVVLVGVLLPSSTAVLVRDPENDT